MIDRAMRFFIFLAVTVVLLSAVVAACGGEEESPTAVPATATPVVAAPTDTPVPAAAPPVADVVTATNSVTATDNVTSGEGTGAADVRVFHIDPSQSEARFLIDEVLLGSPKTVVGVTSDMSGTVTVDLADPSRSTISAIRINARDLNTDESMRNRSIRRFILEAQKDEYQYITFTPTAIEGLPTAATVGAEFTLQVTGDLQIRDISQPVTFETVITPISETELRGLSKTTIQRADFELNIPNVPGVANVAEEVPLEIEFVAIAR
ncbi:MAG: YceI family protein [Chloroflexota bacterium]|nr:YceI family protein [Chloroflexota bacterium]